MTQRIIPILSPNFIADATLENPLDWPSVFGNANPMALEIGCGTGHFVVEMATRQPGTNFLAIDIYNKGCLKTCAKIDQAGLTNVRVMRVEARWLLARSLPLASLAAVYVNCPDPWPKKRHRRRRLVNREFLATLAHYLLPGGDFYFSTDVDNYAEDAATAIRSLTDYRNMLATEWVTALPGYPVSKYMQRFLDKGQPIYFLHYRCEPAATRLALPDINFQRGFQTNWPEAENQR